MNRGLFLCGLAMRHSIVVCLAFMIGFNVACTRVVDLGKDDLHAEPMIEIVSDDTLDIIGFSLAHELATSEGTLPNDVGDEFGYTGSYTYKSYIVRTEYAYQDDGDSFWVWKDTLNSKVGFYPYRNSTEDYKLENIQFNRRSSVMGGSVSEKGRTVLYDTSLLHIIRSATGEDMDIWIPCKPSELRYRCVAYL